MYINRTERKAIKARNISAGLKLYAAPLYHIQEQERLCNNLNLIN